MSLSHYHEWAIKLAAPASDVCGLPSAAVSAHGDFCSYPEYYRQRAQVSFSTASGSMFYQSRDLFYHQSDLVSCRHAFCRFECRPKQNLNLLLKESSLSFLSVAVWIGSYHCGRQPCHSACSITLATRHQRFVRAKVIWSVT